MLCAGAKSVGEGSSTGSREHSSSTKRFRETFAAAKEIAIILDDDLEIPEKRDEQCEIPNGSMQFAAFPLVI